MASEMSQRKKEVCEILTIDLAAHGYKLSKETGCLGIGCYGSVYQVTDADGNKWAVKIISAALRLIHEEFNRTDQKCIIAYLRETTIYNKIGNRKHENLISMHDKFTSKRTLNAGPLAETLTFHYIVFEYASHGTLFDLVCNQGKVSETLAKDFALDLFSAVKFLHKLGISHLDIKAWNCLLVMQNNKYILKLCDLGLATEDKKLHRAMGTLCTLAPEAIRCEVLHQSGVHFVEVSLDAKCCDLWSMGATIYFMLHGMHPLLQYENDLNRIAKCFFFEGRILPEQTWIALLRQELAPFYTELSTECVQAIRPLLEVDATIRNDYDCKLFKAWAGKRSTGRSSQSIRDYCVIA